MNLSYLYCSCWIKRVVDVFYNIMGQCQSACNSDQPAKAPLEQSIRIEYNGEKFIMPQQFSFDKQATFTKVEQAARSFCQQNDISLFYTPLLTRIIAYRNEFIFQEVWKRLPIGDRDEFLEDLNSIEHDLMDSFYHHFVKRIISQQAIHRPPLKLAVPKYTRQSEISEIEKKELRAVGEHLLREGRVAAILMCAGSSSRFDGVDKFLYKPKALSGNCIMDLVFRRLRRNAGAKNDLPIIINCNENNIQKLQAFMKQRQYYGFNPQKIRYFITYTLAIFDRHGKYCLDQKLKLMRRPSGTASCIQYLLNQNIANFLQTEGVEYVCVSGMQNILESPCDPVMLGLMKTQGRKVGAKCVGEMYYGQQLPRYVRNDITGRIQMLNVQQLDQVQPKKIVERLPIATNSMVFDLASLVGIISDYNNSLFLAEKYHVIQKEEVVYNFRIYRPEQRLCYSFQKDLRDVISCVTDPLLYKMSRKTSYAPVMTKNKGYALNDALSYYKELIDKELAQDTLTP